jgi:hypothetical protein
MAIEHVTAIHTPNWAETFIGTMWALKAKGIDPRFRSPYPFMGTPPRRHSGKHNDTSPGARILGRLVRGRFR